MCKEISKDHENSGLTKEFLEKDRKNKSFDTSDMDDVEKFKWAEFLSGCKKYTVQYEQFKVPYLIQKFGKRKIRKEHFGRDKDLEIVMIYYKFLGIEFVSSICHSYLYDPEDDSNRYSLFKLSSGRAIDLKTNDINLVKEILEGEVCDMCKETSGHWDPTSNFSKEYDNMDVEDQVWELYKTACGAEFIFEINDNEE